ncbi:bifunctional 5,10-methylenetetrahydrofolate dehydrogenase/5,10-methenyltetrahydrofolate cyclohydrolase [Candidatus Woesebacteria bacterium]|nr:bifunctional 5,10-methylenetetrahydrofolate dehydrogenase/5,10-methenyltetrahydrofolate cyclohydrolase [Candidatus Woesebacteria bacterium]
MQVFDGVAFASEKEMVLTDEVTQLREDGKTPTIGALLFAEDEGSRLYTRLKKEAADRVGIMYRVFEHTLHDTVETLQAKITELNADPTITGIIVQKPRRSTWVRALQSQSFHSNKAEQAAFQSWWRSLTTMIAAEKDVDGLRPATLEAIWQGNWKQQGLVLPATCQAVLDILEYAQVLPVPVERSVNILVIGRSDILGLPLSFELQHRECRVLNVGSTGYQDLLDTGQGLRSFDVVVSATGKRHLLDQAANLKKGVVLVDVGEPSPDIDRTAVAPVASFLTPVPGGVGPVTVVSLLQNVVQLCGNE